MPTPAERTRFTGRIRRCGVLAWVIAIALLFAFPALLDRRPTDGSEGGEALRFTPYRTVAALDPRETPDRRRVPRRSGS